LSDRKEANIPVFIMENPPPEGKFLGFVDFDNEARAAMGADQLAKEIGEKGVVLETRGSVALRPGSTPPQRVYRSNEGKIPDYRGSFA
jgi:ABC-type sugar transport system substrate-binding protein